jgi:hypothetical protein
MKKIIINETQYKRLFKEQRLDFIPPSMASDSIQSIRHNLTVKSTGSEFKRKLTDVFTKDFLEKPENISKLSELGITIDGAHINELLSGFNIKDANSDQFDDNLIPAVSKVLKRSGVKLDQITGGKDKYHTWGNHSRGKAIDFTIDSGTDENQMKIEKAVIGLITDGDYPNLQFINEYKHTTKKGTGNHFHLVINGKSDLNYYHFIDKDTLEAKVGNKNPLTFNGTGEYVSKIWFKLQKNIPLKRMTPRPPKLLDVPVMDKWIPKVDIDSEVSKAVDTFKDKKRSQIKMTIRQYDKMLLTMKDGHEKEYLAKLNNELKKLLGTNEV